jgi:hypothetical protein
MIGLLTVAYGPTIVTWTLLGFLGWVAFIALAIWLMVDLVRNRGVQAVERHDTTAVQTIDGVVGEMRAHLEGTGSPGSMAPSAEVHRRPTSALRLPEPSL